MRHILAVSAIVAGLSVGMAAAVIPMQGGDVSVTVSYTGKAPVDGTHEIGVFLFDSPAIGTGARPVAVQAIKKSGATAIFTTVGADPVYVGVAYDEKGDYDGNAGPPPGGAPVGIYSTDGKGTPAAVKTAGGAKVKMTFGDARRMQ